MIKVKKTQPPPKSLEKAHQSLLKEINDAIKNKLTVILATKGSKASKEKVSDLVHRIIIDDDLYKPMQAKAILKLDHFGKCAFCEARFMDTAGGDVEHFRPKKRYDDDVRERIGFLKLQEPVGNLGYFQFVYDWNNHLWSCKECNETYKKNYFGLMPDMNTPPPDSDDFSTEEEFMTAVQKWGEYQTSRHTDWNTPNVNEEPILIDPTTDDPREHINFDSDTGLAVGAKLNDQNEVLEVSHRGGKNILILGLNRQELVYSRSRHLNLLRGVFVEMLKDWDQTQEFLGWQRSRQWHETLNDLTRRHLVEYSDDENVENDRRKSCIQFLKYSTTPQAPFTALARDALAVWSYELTLHLLQTRDHVSQLQRPNTESPAPTRSVYNLLPLSMHNQILNCYRRDQEAIEQLKKSVKVYEKIWENSIEPSFPWMVCRTRLHEVVRHHQLLMNAGNRLQTYDYYINYNRHLQDLGEIEEALELYNCPAKDWREAVNDMETNLNNYPPDPCFDLITETNAVFSNIARLNNLPHIFDGNAVKLWSDLGGKTVLQLKNLQTKVEKRVEEIRAKVAVINNQTVMTMDQDEDMFLISAVEMLNSLENAKTILDRISNKQRSDEIPEQIEVHQEKLLIPKPTGIQKKVENADFIWNTAILPQIRKQ